jgi:hypothetical protein
MNTESQGFFVEGCLFVLFFCFCFAPLFMYSFPEQEWLSRGSAASPNRKSPNLAGGGKLAPTADFITVSKSFALNY